jgi:hypothetical protein
MLLVLLVVAPPARAGVIVSVGDSYSSGEGNAPYDDDSRADPQPCHRSAQGWPRLIGVSKEHHLACSGAKVENLNDKAQVKEAPDSGRVQLERLTSIAGSSAIQRVVMTIGGNDKPISFASRLRNCYLVECIRDPDRIIADLPMLRARLETAYRGVMQVSHAPLLVVGYPDLLPRPGSASAKRARRHCAWISRGAIERMDKVASAVDNMTSARSTSAGC